MKDWVCLILWRLSKLWRIVRRGDGIMRALVRSFVRNVRYEPQTVERAKEIICF